MATQKLTPETTEQDAFEQAALAIVARRICHLPADDRADLLELIKALPQAESDEERESIAVALREILQQRPLGLREMPPDPAEPGPGLQKWMDFVGRTIRTLREQAGLTQSDLAARSGLPQSHISRLETGRHSPSHATLQKIAQALSVNVSQLDPSAAD